MLAVSFRVPQVSVMPFRILLSATLVIFFVLVSFVSAEERTVAEFVDYSSRRISNADDRASRSLPRRLAHHQKEPTRLDPEPLVPLDNP